MRLVHRALLLSLIAALGLGVGCGDDDAPKPAETSSAVREIRAAIAAFYGNDQARICATLSSSALRGVGGRKRCVGSATQPLTTRFEIKEIRIRGTSARARVNASGMPVDFRFVREAGKWRIERPLPLVF